MSTADILSRSHNVLRAKQRAKREQIKEITFNDEARSDFLTGFHKRKLARTQEKKDKAIAREKQQHLEARRETRKSLAEQARKNAAAVERALGATVPSDSEAEEEIASTRYQRPPRADEMEFEDEEQLATVTVVEDFTTDDLILGPQSEQRHSHAELSRDRLSAHKASREEDRQPARSAPTAKTKAKTRAPKFRYETKAARKYEKSKQKVRQASKAEMALGGRPRSGKKGSKRR